ncbi:MAG: lysoplasmalogenase [Myxococcales bacterium]|nr:lysoplasmalogenase [Myxococcales bacterium]
MLVLATVLALVLHLAADRAHLRVGRALTKTAASAGFIAIAVDAGALASTWGQVLLVALGLSMLGDIFLLSRATKMFASGLVAFLLAHIAYGVAFVVRGIDLTAAAAAAVVVAALALGTARWVLPHVPDKLRAAVIAYIFAVSGMAILAVAAGYAAQSPALAVAGVAFFISDLFVARHRFVARGFINRLIGLPLYYGAQILFALHAAPPLAALLAC